MKNSLCGSGPIADDLASAENRRHNEFNRLSCLQPAQAAARRQAITIDLHIRGQTVLEGHPTHPPDRPLRVLCALGSLQGGGSERQMLGLLRAFDRTRIEPHLYLIARQGELLGELPPELPVTAYWDRHRPPRWNWPGRIFRSQVRDLAEQLRAEQIDVVYDRTYHMTMITAEACRKAGVPRVSVVVAEPKNDLITNERRFRWLKYRLLRRAYQTAGAVVAVSDSVRAAICQYYAVSPDRVQVIANGIDLRRLDDPSTDRPGMFSPTGQQSLLVVGRLHPDKGIDLLLRAVAQLQREPNPPLLQVHLLGTGPAEPELRQLAGQLGLQSTVNWQGFQSDIAGWMRSADLFCLPSRFEGLPNALIEAMALGLPVVATRCSSATAELLRSGEWGEMVPTEDVIALARAIRWVCEHPAEARTRAAAARDTIRQEYTMATCVERTTRLLESVAGSRMRAKR